jgi:hypothetical protein
MDNWFDIIEPHQDIKDGDFDEAVFAAKLDEVVAGTAAPDYNDPYLFFKKTYFTEGINALLKKVEHKLSGGKGSSVIEIQTQFGGGKTHALISIYHYIKNGTRIKDLLPQGLELSNAKMGVIVGTPLNPLEGRKKDGLTINTLWGDIAYQLAGIEGYKEFEKNDKERISPGKDKLRDFLKKQQPFIILFDEILEYITKAIGVQYGKTSLGSQTYAFLQELTETVSSTEKGMMIVTLPSSYLEDFGEKKEEALVRLAKIFGRVESIETPVKGEEVYSIISRRLFQEIIDQSKKDKIIHEYFKLYQKNKDELPQKARDTRFNKKMELAYPFHPDVIDILNEKWGTFSSFQRTRGVLRLLANVVEDLYNSEKNIDIILPSDINLEKPKIRQEFLRHIGSEYGSIFDSDIAGHDAKSQAMDNENKGWKHLAERVSTAVFFHSFTAGDSQKGIDLPYIKLATMHRDTIPSMVTEILQKLSNSLWYLNEKGGKYYFSKIPNLNRMILDKKELYNDGYEDELREVIKKESGNAFSLYLWSQKSEDIPDNTEIKLAILHPKFGEGEVDSWLDKKGNSFRTYKNTLIFAFSEAAAFGFLKEQIKTYLALNEVKSEVEAGKNELLKEKLPEITERIKKIKKDYSYNVRKMYHTIQKGSEIIDLGQPMVGNEALSIWYKNQLESKDKIVTNLHYRIIVDKFLRSNVKVCTKTILEQFYKDKDLPILASPEMLKRAIQNGVSDAAFCLAYIKDEKIADDSFKFQTRISTGEITFDEHEYLLSKETCIKSKELIEKEKVSGSSIYLPPEQPTVPIKEPPTATSGGTDAGRGKAGVTATKYKKVVMKFEDIPSTKIADFNRGVLMPISQEIGDFKLKIELDISDQEGILKSTIENKIRETIAQICGKIVKEELE